MNRVCSLVAAGVVVNVGGPSLATIFSKTLETIELPSDWKDANVAPIFKWEKYHL